ncbi:MAG: pyridoxal-phosphate dependent enzyme [Angelakisella sp.]|jgi:threonine synthase|nr:pyridoxal-phosphate dependent enzyme [Angelakisella sp.]
MSWYKEAVCMRCGRPLDGKFYDACPKCAEESVNVNYRTIYDLSSAKLPAAETTQPGIYRFRDFYPLEDSDPVVSIGEGNTPLHRLERMGKQLGLEQLWMKDESKNPTMSHKDRLCSLIISKALAEKAPGITISSTGNQGAAAAAYAAVAGLPCVIFTTSNVSPSMKTLMQAYGASVFVTPSMADRGVIMEKLVRELDFVPASGVMSPPIGSSCFGIDAYKSIAFEVFEQMGGRVPDWFVVPISYGDTLYGIYKGMCDLKEMGYIEKVPKFAAAEVFHAVENTIKAGSSDPIPQPSEPSIQTSIATGFCAYHTVQAVKDSGGAARSSHDPEALKMQQRLAKTEGVFGESASVASLVVLEKLLKEGVVRPDEKVVVLMTSTGVKTPEVTDMWVPEIPCIQPTLADFRSAMESSYGIKI